MPLVIPPDLEAFLVRYLAAALAARGVDAIVSTHEPAGQGLPLERPLVVIRDDGGPQTSALTFSRAVGVSVLGGARQDEKATRDLAALVYGLGSSLDIVEAEGSPIAAVNFDGGNLGPYREPEPGDVARFYLSLEFSVVGEIVAGPEL